MANITIANIRNRINGLKTKRNSNTIVTENFINAKNTNVRNAVRLIESQSKSSNNIPFNNYLSLFDYICENGSVNDIKNAASCIIENELPKVRDSKATNSLLRRRLTLMQHKFSNPITKSINDAINAVSSTLDLSKFRQNRPAIEESYNRILDKSIEINHCDRILENYSRISKRFNLDRLFIEDTRIDGIWSSVIDLCEMVDTYDMPTNIKFNTVIETAWYGFESNCIDYSKTDILNAAVDYFAFKKDGIESCKNILESTILYDKDDVEKMDMDVFTEEEPEYEISGDINSELSKMLKESSEVNFKDIFNKFKKEESAEHPESKIKSLINKLYARNVNSIVESTPDLLQWIRKFFILGSCAIPTVGPVIAAIGYVVNKFLEIHADRKNMPKMIKCFSNEIKKSKDKLKETNDPEEKEKLEKYIEALKDGKAKMDQYYNNIVSEDDDDTDDYSNSNDFDDDFDDFDMEDMFENTIEIMNDTIRIQESSIITEDSMFNLAHNAINEDLVNIAKISTYFPNELYQESFVSGLNSAIHDIKHKPNNSIQDFIRLSSLNTAKGIIESGNINMNTNSIQDSSFILECANESISAINIMIDTYNSKNTLLEASFLNTLKAASVKLKNSLTKLTDKQKSIAKNIDLSVDNFKKNIEKALTNDNRESIIKGSILPSFSKVLKLGIVNASLIILNQPAIAAITTLGYFAVNYKFKAKERQMVVDEIDIELEMCERYINIAEQKNDMVALKQLLTTKKELERQRQRIKYKMKVDFGQKYYDSKDTGDNK